MNDQNAIVIVVDRLGAGYLGPYGNTWVETPAFNRLASQSLLWEHVIATAPTLAGAYRSLQTGIHPLARRGESSPNLWERMQQSGIHTAFLTDEPQCRELLPADAFDERIELPTEVPLGSAPSWEESQLCRLFLAGLDWLTHPRKQFCLVLHSRGMSGAWDAPREFRERFVDEGDPPALDFIEPPNRSFGRNADPDELLGIVQAYAGQVALLDACLEMLLDELAERRVLDHSLLMLTSPRGFPLGEHGNAGACGDRLHEELVHLPLLIRRSDQRHAMERCQKLAEPADLHATLAEWMQLPPESPAGNSVSLLAPHSSGPRVGRECVVSMLDRDRSIRTPAWLLRRTPEDPCSNPLPKNERTNETREATENLLRTSFELYAKPDDRWEVNEVADRGGPVVEELAARLVEFESLAEAGRLAEMAPLPEHLLRRAD